MAESDAALADVIGREFQRDLVASQDTDMVLAHFSGSIGDQLVTIFEQNAKTGIGQDFFDHALHFDEFFFCHGESP